MPNEEIKHDIILIDIANDEVFIYVNPLRGKHVSINSDIKALAVFINEKVGRQYETISDTLCQCIGYHVCWDEMLDIANKECEGRYELYKAFNV